MTWTSANRMCRWVGLVQKAAVDRCGWGLGAEEIPARRVLAELAPFVRFDPVRPLWSLCSPQLRWRPGSCLHKAYEARWSVHYLLSIAARLGGGKWLLIFPL